MSASHGWIRRAVKPSLIAVACFALLGAGREEGDDKPVPFAVPKAVCGPNDHPETALQGQVPAAMRAAGFKGFNCNLELLGQSRGNGANWQTTQFKQRARDDEGDDNERGGKARVCGYHGTASPKLS